jgi:hypothetical protein
VECGLKVRIRSAEAGKIQVLIQWSAAAMSKEKKSLFLAIETAKNIFPQKFFLRSSTWSIGLLLTTFILKTRLFTYL